MKKGMDSIKLIVAGAVLFVVSFLLLNSMGCTDSGKIFGSEDKEEYVENLERTLDPVGLGRLEARTINGYIDVEGSRGMKLLVAVDKRVRAPSMREAEDFAEKVEIRIEARGDLVLVSANYPKPPRDVEVEVSYDIQCPAEFDLALQTLNGGIEVRGSEGRVEGGTTNGKVDVRGMGGPFFLSSTNGNIGAELEGLVGEGSFSTTNGSIDVRLRSGKGSLTATTTNGSIEMELPPDFAGQLNASTTNGRVRSDFHAPPNGENRQMWISGPIGDGGEARVRARTTNGNIDVEKR
jgi:hypothetical protein